MKKLLKNMSKVLSIFLLLCSVAMQPSGFSEELTNQFVKAFEDRCLENALRMLDDHAIVPQIDVNARDKCDDTLFLLACKEGYYEIIDKLLELRKPDGSLLVDVNAKSSCGNTPLMHACCHGHQGVVEKLLKLQKPDGSLRVDVNAKDKDGCTPLINACCHGHQGVVEKLLELRKPDGSLLVDVNAKSIRNTTSLKTACGSYGNQGIIKTLLIHGADGTMLSDETNLRTLPKSFQKNILLVFDALKPGIEQKKGTGLEAPIFDAYKQFLRGNHADLRNLLLVLPGTMKKRMDGKLDFINPISSAMCNVFKKESIKPLLYFLAEKQYQRNMVEVFSQALEDNSDVDHREAVEMTQPANRLLIEDGSLRE